MVTITENPNILIGYDETPGKSISKRFDQAMARLKFEYWVCGCVGMGAFNSWWDCAAPKYARGRGQGIGQVTG